MPPVWAVTGTLLLSKQNLYPNKGTKMFLHGTGTTGKFLWNDTVRLISISEVCLSEFLPCKISLTSHFIYTKLFIRKLLFRVFFPCSAAHVAFGLK